MNEVKGYALAPKQLVEKKERVCYMYREHPDNISDSGWRFFGSTDSDVSDPALIGLYDLKTILNLEPDVKPFLCSSYGHAFERDNERLPFTEVPFMIED